MAVVVVDTKWCGGCSSLCPRSVFHRASARPDGLQSQCKACQARANKANKDANPERVRARSRAWSQANRTKKTIRCHGLSMDDFATLVIGQAGRCANKGCAVPLIGDALHIDHDHGCCPGRFGCIRCVRALLCRPCNQAIGMMRDCPDRARGAAEYLELHRGQ
jgi:hypothetical protein